ncbi:MAG: adenine phosphoribosyltransferase [Thaumarchaeota archaeon]|nr:adenine phosphoribosyltransferase [Nitrososphaerota archaeon]
MNFADELKAAIRNVPDYPKKGIVFRDLTTLWKDGPLFKRTTDALFEHYKRKKVEKVVGIEARGFIVGAPLSERLGVGFVPARKSGKLPSRKLEANYELEYGKQGLEIHEDAISRGERVLIVDDLLATGGTSLAATRLVEQLGGSVIGFAFVVELAFLRGREKLSKYEVYSLVRYDTE